MASVVLIYFKHLRPATAIVLCVKLVSLVPFLGLYGSTERADSLEDHVSDTHRSQRARALVGSASIGCEMPYLIPPLHMPCYSF